MKKMTKICLILSAVLFLIGTVALFAGISMGARLEEFLQVNLGGGQINLNGYPRIRIGTYSPDIDEAADKETIPAGQLEELNLRIGAGEVGIYLSPAAEEIICYSNRSHSLLSVKGDTLTIKDDILNPSLKLELYLPEKIWKEIDLELGACSAYIERMEAQDVSIELGAGTVSVDSLSYLDSADLQVGAGKLSVNTCEGKELQLECGMGSLQITLAGKKADYNYRLECGAGTIFLQDEEFYGIGPKNRVDNQAAKQVKAECGIGEIIIALEENN